MGGRHALHFVARRPAMTVLGYDGCDRILRTPMPIRPEYRAFVIELFEEFGPVSVRPMFGAAGIFAGDVMFGIVEDERIYLKTGEDTRKAFEDEGAAPFTYEKTNEKIVTSYFELPARLYDDPGELAQWARRAHEIASRSPAARKKLHTKAKAGARQPVRRRSRS
jgi:DNA transformation protein